MTIQNPDGIQVLSLSGPTDEMKVGLKYDPVNTQIFVTFISGGQAQQLYASTGVNPAVIYEHIKVTATSSGTALSYLPASNSL